MGKPVFKPAKDLKVGDLIYLPGQALVLKISIIWTPNPWNDSYFELACEDGVKRVFRNNQKVQLFN